ncbi:ribonuclease D [Anaerosoma tenue]|uniref:ribonuclease D n=1 Tax=Anaerosoma tenue TaxID=2933588 RepID=UPI0022608FCB|nr:ribonuclease D [Anaerosoma tenue]
MYIRDTESLADTIETLMAAPVVAVDTEFMRERTYYARLCLVQLGTAEESFVVDAVALEGKLEPLARLLTAPHVVKVVHAGSQDVEILLRATGSTVAPVFDTQIAATLAGFPVQVGYAQLVKDLLGVHVDKSDTFTDWAARPLTPEQVEYAEADVRYLPEVYERLHERLEREGRLAWLAEDFERLADPKTYEVDPREQYRRVKRASSLDRRSLAVLRELAAWRETEAQRRDTPKRWLISDESLVEIARRTPGSAAELSGIRGVNDKVASRSGAAVIAAIRAGQAVPEDELPRLPRKDRIPSGAQAVADLLSAVLRIRAREHNVATTLLASRDELERFAAGDRDGHPLSTGWRRTLVGAELAAIADGATAVRVKDGRLAVIPVDPPSEASGSDDA